MKILYGANNYTGSNIILSRFLENISDHEIKICAYFKNSNYLKTVNWTLDALYSTNVGDKNYFKEHIGIKGPYINHSLADIIIDDLLEWGPELVISDCEPFTATIAKVLSIPLWYCSAMLQLVGLIYKNKINKKFFDKIKNKIGMLPNGDRYLIYSPMCDVLNKPPLKHGFEWVRPYSKKPEKLTTEEGVDLSIINKCIPKDIFTTTGETSFISDGIYSSGKMVIISPNPNDFEQMLNAQLFHKYNAAINIGRSTDISFIKSKVDGLYNEPILNVIPKNPMQLDEILDYEKSSF